LKAIVFNQHGGSDVLEYAEVAAPRPAAGEALVAVGAVAVNHGPDVETRRRGFMMGELPMPHIGGTDPAGEIVELGSSVSDFSVGERVAIYPVIACGECDFCLAGAGENYCRNSRLFGVQTPGGRAQYVAVPTTQLVRLPDAVSFEAAAALGVAYTTTWHGLVERASVSAQDVVLVVGAGGGCGVAAVQLAKHFGARVIALTGEQWKQERLVALGADVVLSYRDPDWPQAVREAAGVRGVTVAFDNAGTATLPKTLECLGRTGKLVCSGGTSGLEATINIRTLYRNHISMIFYVQGVKRDMERLVELVASGDLVPVIDREYPLRDAALADDYLDTGEHFGRIVLWVEPDPARGGVGSAMAGGQVA
jgi:NADPH:quinone reductase-like Zn-dependent oxidoreductase